MAEYIERNALIDEINIAPVSMSICMNVDECKGRIYERERLVRIIIEATAADVVPVRHGRWALIGYNHGLKVCECSVCKKRAYGSTKYCPNCGALMDKDGDGE